MGLFGQPAFEPDSEYRAFGSNPQVRWKPPVSPDFQRRRTAGLGMSFLR